MDSATRPNLPPVFAAIACAQPNAFAQACALAGEAGAADIFWVEGAELLDCALVLEPEQPLVLARQALHIGVVALADTLSALGPPNTDVTIRWPNEIYVNGGLVAQVRLAASPAEEDEPPARMVLGFLAEIRGEAENPDPGLRYEETTLAQEGYEVDPQSLLESLGRHTLYWISRWQEDGLPPVAKAWQERAGAQRLDLLGSLEEPRGELAALIEPLELGEPHEDAE